MANQPQGLNGFNPLGYMGVNPTTPMNFKGYNRAPTTNDNSNFLLGDHWEWQQTERVWILVAKTGGIGTWKEIAFGGADSFPTDSGTATPLAGVLNIFGGTGIETSGSGNTVTITTTGDVAQIFHTDVGDAIPAANILNVLGGSNMNTAAVPDLGNNLIINLNTSILQPATTADGTEGMYSLGSTGFLADRFMYAYGNTNTFLGLTAGNTTLTKGTAVNTVGVGAASLSSLTVGVGNTAVGAAAMNATTTASQCVAVGNLSQTVNDTSPNNTSVGSNSLVSLNGGTGSNVAMGSGSLILLLDGNDNVCLGSGLGALTTGDFNVTVGNGAGDSYLAAESSNILISNSGTLGESNTIRIGTQGTGDGQQNSAYMAGVYTGTLGATNKVTMVDSTGKLAGSRGSDGQILIGATGGTGSPAWANITSTGGTITVTNGANTINLETADGAQRALFSVFMTTAVTNVTGNNAVYTVLFDTISYDTTGGYSAITGMYTVPYTGVYLYTIQITYESISAGMVSGVIFFRTGGAVADFVMNQDNAFVCSNPGTPPQPTSNGLGEAFSLMVFQNAGDTPFIQVRIAGAGANTAGVTGNAVGGLTHTYWQGMLMGTP